jgi:hypothetical protein
MNSRFLFSILIGLFLTSTLSAQCINGTDSYPIYKQGASLVSDFDGQGLEIVKIEYDIVRDSKNTFSYLSPDWEYSIYVFGDDGVKDIDLYLYEYDDLLEEWDLVEEDIEESYDALIFFQPNEYAQYKIEVYVAEFYEGYTAARYGLFFIHD